MDEALGIYVRHWMPIHTGWWLIRPVLYLDHVENSVGPLGLEGRAGRLATGILTAAGTALLVWVYTTARQSQLFKTSIGLLLGGGIANTYEVVALGSATDYLGVRTLGIFNVADIAINAGLLLMISSWRPRVETYPRWVTARRLVLFAVGMCSVEAIFALIDLSHGRTSRTKTTVLLIVVSATVVWLQSRRDQQRAR